MKLFVFISKSCACFCAGFIAEDMDEALKFMAKTSGYDARQAEDQYLVKAFELSGSHEKGEVFWEEE
jgi:hypothetical protein